MPSVRIPTPLRRCTGGRARVEVEGEDVAEVLAALERAHPGIGSRVLDDAGRLRGFVHVFVGDVDVRAARGLATPVPPDATIVIVPAVAGGR